MIRSFFLISLLGLSTMATASDDFDIDGDTEIPTETDSLDDLDELPEVTKKKVKTVTVDDADEDDEELTIDMSSMKTANPAPQKEKLNFDLPEEQEDSLSTEQDVTTAPAKEEPPADANFTINMDEEEEEEEEVRRPVKKQTKEKDIEFDINIDEE